MKLFLRAAAYAALLSLPGHWLASTYQALLIGITGTILGIPLDARPGSAVDLSAANLLVVYLSLCLASAFASWRRRLTAIAFGLPLVITVECLSGIVDLAFLTTLPGAVPLEVGERGAAHQLLELSRWLAVPLVWAGLLGRLALSRGARAGSRESSQPRPPVSKAHPSLHEPGRNVAEPVGR